MIAERERKEHRFAEILRLQQLPLRMTQKRDGANLEFGQRRVRLPEAEAGVICEISEIAVSGQERDFVVEA